MKYGFNTAPIAGPRRQYGTGTAVLALAVSGSGVKAVSGRGTATLSLSLSITEQVVPRVTGLADLHLGVSGDSSGVFFIGGTANMSLILADQSVSPIAVQGAGASAMRLAARYAIPAKVMPRPGFAPAPGRGFSVSEGPRGFTVQPDSTNPVPQAEGFAVPAQGAH